MLPSFCYRRSANNSAKTAETATRLPTWITRPPLLFRSRGDPSTDNRTQTAPPSRLHAVATIAVVSVGSLSICSLSEKACSRLVRRSSRARTNRKRIATGRKRFARASMSPLARAETPGHGRASKPVVQYGGSSSSGRPPPGPCDDGSRVAPSPARSPGFFMSKRKSPL